MSTLEGITLRCGKDQLGLRVVKSIKVPYSASLITDSRLEILVPARNMGEALAQGINQMIAIR